uniref:Tail fiber protein n=1 Tax=Pakpunavirus sp. TaxID=2833053 RepID=A0AB39C097_9CAUD
MTYNTGNPVPSTDPRDLLDNAQALDGLVNGALPAYPDRKRVARKSWAGMEADFAAAQGDKEQRFQAFLLASGYVDIGDYAAGLSITARNQVFRRDGEFYRATAALELPYTLTGDWVADAPQFVAVGDAVLRQDIWEDAGWAGYVSPLAGAVRRTLGNRLSDTVSVKDFGAKGDYDTDDTAAIIAADQYCFDNGKTLFFPSGQYACSNGITRKARWVGAGAPVLGTFPISGDDKTYLRPGYKTQMPGSSLIFKGTGTAAASTVRTDRFSSFTYCVMDDPASKPQLLEGIAIVMDMDVYDAAGNITSVSTDNRSAYDVGHYRACGWGSHVNLVVFGYFPKAGTVIYGVDPDYNHFDPSCSTSGDIGLAIIGTGTSGLSGTVYEGRLFANDHHSRSRTANQWGTTALYIDGAIPTASPPQNSIGGHFFRGSIRTYADNPFVLGYANTVVFENCVFEWPNYADSIGATKAVPVGTINTYGVVMDNCRHLNPIAPEGIYSFANSIGGGFIHSDPRHGNLGLSFGGRGAFLRSSGGNPSIQLTADVNGMTTGWNILENLASADRLELRYNNATVGHLSSTGTFTANRLVGVVSGSSSAADPSIRLSASDAQSGFYRPGPNNIAVSIAGVKVFDWQSDGVPRPGADNAYSLGSGSFRWSQVYAATATISTSDENQKTEIADIPDAVLDAWSAVGFQQFRFSDAVNAKGGSARLHVGVIAQRVQAAFEQAGIDPFAYGLLCLDAWGDQYEAVTAVRDVVQEDGSTYPEEYETGEQRLVKEAGQLYGVRYEEALALEAALMRRTTQRLEARLAALENS